MVTFTRPNNLPRFSDAEPQYARQTAHVQPIPVNVHYLMTLNGEDRVAIGDMPLRVPTIPSVPGAELHRAVARIGAFMAGGSDDVDEFIKLSRELQRRCTALVRPCSKRGRLARLFGLWRPLRNASDGDLKGLADFLLQRRAKSSIRLLN